MVIISARPAIAAGLASCYAQHPIPAKILSPDDDWSNRRPGDLVLFDTLGLPRSLERLAEFTAMAPDIRRVAVLSYPSDLAALLARRAGANAVITELESADEWKTVLDRVSLESFDFRSRAITDPYPHQSST